MIHSYLSSRNIAKHFETSNVIASTASGGGPS